MPDESEQCADAPVLVLDTTVLLSDPACSGTAWRVLAHATRAWGIRVLVPAVVLLEAVGGYSRRLEGALIGLERWNDKHGHALGLGEVADDATSAIRMRADAYESTLRQVLAEVGAEILPMPEVDHGELVARAVARRRPCDDKGDGYRDTLNWFSVLALLERDPTAQIVWISENTADFAGVVDQQLHEHLLEDLRAIEAELRLVWLPRLSDAVAHIAAQRVDSDAGSGRQVQDALEFETLSTFVTGVLADQVTGSKVSPEKTGLPIKTLEASVADLREERGLSYTTAAIVGDAAIVEFAVEADALMEVRVPLDQPAPDHWVIVAQGDHHQLFTLVKPLRIEGILEVDSFGRPISGEVRSVHALGDDPGLGPWLLRRTLRTAWPDTVDFNTVRTMTEGIQFDQLDGLRKVAEGMKFDQLDGLRKVAEGIKFDQLDAIRRIMDSMGNGPETRTENSRETPSASEGNPGDPDPSLDADPTADGSDDSEGNSGGEPTPPNT